LQNPNRSFRSEIKGDNAKMRTRGRVSTAELTVVGGAGGVRFTEKPKPPPELEKEEVEEWHKIVDRMPPDWFGPESLPLLIQYVHHIVRARKINEVVKKMESTRGSKDFNPRTYMSLLRSEISQSRALALLATKMRISQQSTYDKRVRKSPKVEETKKLWSSNY